ncbi:MAG: hypothetical protein NZ601_00640 [candidate division WOR-3 bacterium]|nr:hypothetical protein [candidate division WOR-3 bacterium]MCX7757934.1 hypothetical protein [candidate division WOR-3 bacterium]MDW7987696.1 hypothetical protein [candidate division WOR-3 bacterium]
MKVLIFLLTLIILSCTLPPIAFNYYCPPVQQTPRSSEFGFSLSGYFTYNQANRGYFTYFPVWYHKRINEIIDIGARGYFLTTSGALVGPELAINLKPIKLICGFYPFLFISSDGPGIFPFYYQASIVVGNEKIYFGSIASPLAFGARAGINFPLNNNWELRSELSYILPPFWINDGSIQGRAVSLGIALAKINR